MFALELYESEVHSDGCGFHRTLATDPNNLFLPKAEFCPLCAAVAVREREQQAEWQKAAEKAGGDPRAKLPTDGLRISTMMLSPAEAERRRAEARRAQATSHSM